MTGYRTMEARELMMPEITRSPGRPDMELTMGIPSKGRLSKGSERLLELAGVNYQRLPRQLVTWANFGENQGFYLALMRQEDILERVTGGELDLGIVGSDCLNERYPDFNRFVFDRPVGLARDGLSFGRCKMVLAVPENFKIRKNFNVLDALNRKVVGTSYPRTASSFLNNGIRKVEIVEARGAVEGMVQMGWVDAIVDLVETGRSLRENGLVPLETVADVRAMLIMNFDSATEKRVNDRFYPFLDALSKANKDIGKEPELVNGA